MMLPLPRTPLALCTLAAIAATPLCQERAAPAAKRTESRRDAILAIARRYAEHEWKATKANVLHGVDENGIRVDTPDRGYRKAGFRTDGTLNIGVPYKWGGFESIEEFDAGIKSGKAAGHLPRKGSSRRSHQAVGVDCSGFVSRCWSLPNKHSTRSIGNICYVLPDYGELQPGDIVNSFDGHVVLFEKFVDAAKTELAVYEAGGTRVQRSVYPVAKLRKNGYKALRYKPLDERWTAQKLAPASFRTSAEGKFVATGEASEPSEPWVDPLRDARPGAWTRYVITGGETATRSILRKEAGTTVLRLAERREGRVQENEVERPYRSSMARSLIDFAGLNQNLRKIELRSSSVTDGKYELGDRSFEARRLQAEIRASILSRGVDYAMTIKVDCVLSKEVPMSGVLEAGYAFEMDRNRGPASVIRLQLRAFHGGS